MIIQNNKNYILISNFIQIKKDMNLKKLFLTAALGASMNAPVAAQEQDVLTGTVRLACEAILCLATGSPPSECSPSLSRYFSISHKRFSDTIRGRINFLKLCPVANQSPEMASLINAMGNGAGRCDATSLNNTLQSWMGDSDYGYMYISNSMPSYCAVYTNHAYTDMDNMKPMYVGLPERGGHWVEPAKYDQALAIYNARVASEDAQRQWYGYGGW